MAAAGPCRTVVLVAAGGTAPPALKTGPTIDRGRGGPRAVFDSHRCFRLFNHKMDAVTQKKMKKALVF